MRVCLPVLDGRVSPVLDVARTLLVVDLEGRAEESRFAVRIEDQVTAIKSRRIAALEPDLLICGAISRELEELLRSCGIDLIPNICGAIDEILAAFVHGDLRAGRFLMPGCAGGRQRARRGHR